MFELVEIKMFSSPSYVQNPYIYSYRPLVDVAENSWLIWSYELAVLV